MAQKNNPDLLRVGRTNSYLSRWYVNDKNAPIFISEDKKIRVFCEKNYKSAFIDRVEIERPKKNTNNNGEFCYDLIIKIFAVYPNIIIGQNNEGIKKAEKKIKSQISFKYNDFILKIVKIEDSDLCPNILAKKAARAIEKRESIKKIRRDVITSSTKNGSSGVYIKFSGRINGAEIARSESYKKGTIPTSTMKKDVQYGFEPARTTSGIIGVKVIVHKNNKKDVNNNNEVDKSKFYKK